MASSRLIPAPLRAAPTIPAASPAPSPHGAQHETEVMRRIAAFLPSRYSRLSRAVAPEGFRRIFPRVPWSNEGNDRGRGTPLCDGYAEDGSVAYGGHYVGFKSRVGEEGKSNPSATFDVFGPSPNVEHALAGLTKCADEGKPFPVLAFFRTAGDFNSPFRVLAWAGDDLPSMLVAARAKVAREGAPVQTVNVTDKATGRKVAQTFRFGVFCGIPEVPPNMPSVGRAGYHGVTLYVTQPDADGYRTLRVSMKGHTFDLTSGEAGMARWLVSDGWPTRARKR